jgi:hypothetical protein
MSVQTWSLACGREFSDAELQSGAAVCIIGETVRKERFSKCDPIGSGIRLQSISCQIVGLLEAKGRSDMGNDQDDLVLIPIQTFQRRVSRSRYINEMLVGRWDKADSAKFREDIERLLR